MELELIEKIQNKMKSLVDNYLEIVEKCEIGGDDKEVFEELSKIKKRFDLLMIALQFEMSKRQEFQSRGNIVVPETKMNIQV